MKSVLRSIEVRQAEQIDDSSANDPLSATGAAAMESASEQLAELKLLSRVEHVVSPSALSCASGEEDGGGTGEDGESRRERRDTGRGEKKSMFTALLGTTKKVAVNQPAPAAALSSSSSTLGLVSASTSPPKSPASERFRRASTLPTLCEESFEEAEELQQHRSDDKSDLDPTYDEDDTEILQRPARSRSKGDSDSHMRSDAARSEDVDDADGDAIEGGPEDSDQDEDEEDDAFLQMLSQLSRDFEQLTLSTSDLTIRRLDKVRAALTIPPQSAAHAAINDERSSASEPREESSAALLLPTCSTLSSVSRMRQTRTLVAVDTIRMLLRRYGHDDTLQAITHAVRRVFQQHALENGIEPLAQAPVVITSNNITHVALDARRALVTGDRSSQSSNNSHHRRHCSATLSVPLSQTQQQMWSPNYFRSSTITRNPSSPNQSRSPRGASSAGSDAMAGNSSPLTPQPRSILASEGVHVLMQEKISAFQYRGSGGNGLSAFKVRRDGAAKVEAAAMRRQRSVAYGNEQTRKPPLK